MLTNNQTKKQTNIRNKLCKKLTLICIVSILGSEKCLMKFAAASTKTLKTMNYWQSMLHQTLLK